VRRIEVSERRARLGRRHRLAAATRADTALDVAHDLVALHGTDPASVFLAAFARLRAPDVGAIERTLYDQRALVRILGMRRTMFVVPRELAPIVHAACTRAIAVQERRRLVQLLEAAGVASDVPGWLADLEEAILAALADGREATAAELAAAEPRLSQKILLAEGKSYAAWQSVSTRILFLLAADGRIIRTRPRGSWTSSQYRWTLLDTWLPGGLPELPPEAARVELIRRWLAAFGPATAADARWWTGWTAGETNRALKEAGAVEVALDGATGLVLPDDLEPVSPVPPWAALLPALDPTVMGWIGRGWFLGAHGPMLFDRSGNVGPTVWWDGRVVGGWAQRPDGQIVIRLLEDVGAEAAAAVDAAADELGRLLGKARITPRFRTPLERELVGEQRLRER
jgi:hypothetical protein